MDLHQRPIPGVAYEAAELGAGHRQPPGDLLAALRLPTRGRVYDLDCGRWPGMPIYPLHPPFLVTAYRSPQGIRNVGDLAGWAGANTVGMSLNTEIVMGTQHTGTHVDALNHITRGPDDHWHGGYTTAGHWTDFGPRKAEGSSMPPWICRGVLADVAGSLGVEVLDREHIITLEQTRAALRTEVRPGDAVLFRTGYLRVWGTDRAADHAGAGIDTETALWLAERGATIVGADQEGLERMPSPVAGNPHPVHIALLVERGVHILEMAYLEDLARDRVDEFLFVCLPVRIYGTTGAMVRPVAIT